VLRTQRDTFGTLKVRKKRRSRPPEEQMVLALLLYKKKDKFLDFSRSLGL